MGEQGVLGEPKRIGILTYIIIITTFKAYKLEEIKR